MIMVKMKGCIFMEITKQVAAYIGQGCAPLKAIKTFIFHDLKVLINIDIRGIKSI